MNYRIMTDREIQSSMTAIVNYFLKMDLKYMPVCQSSRDPFKAPYSPFYEFFKVSNRTARSILSRTRSAFFVR